MTLFVNSNKIVDQTSPKKQNCDWYIKCRNINCPNTSKIFNIRWTFKRIDWVFFLCVIQIILSSFCGEFFVDKNVKGNTDEEEE